MLANVREDTTASGPFAVDGRTFPVAFRIRGASTRFVAKKSWRIAFAGATPWPDRPGKVVYLKAEHPDFSLMQEKLTCDVFAAMNLPASQARYVNLVLNGKHQGVYLDIEPIRTPFKQRAGLDPAGTLIRAGSFQHLEGSRKLGRLRGAAGSLSELAEFLRQVSRVDRGDFEAFTRNATDWPKLRGYLVASLICHRSEIEADDYFFFRDSRTGQWSFRCSARRSRASAIAIRTGMSCPRASSTTSACATTTANTSLKPSTSSCSPGRWTR